MVVEITGVEGLNQIQAVQPKETLLAGSSVPSSTIKSSHMFPINPLQEQYVVNTLCMHLSFLGTQLANLIQILCFPPPLWQRKGFLSLKCDNNKFQSHLLSALFVLWSYHRLMGNIRLGSMLKKIVSTLLIA